MEPDGFGLLTWPIWSVKGREFLEVVGGWVSPSFVTTTCSRPTTAGSVGLVDEELLLTIDQTLFSRETGILIL